MRLVVNNKHKAHRYKNEQNDYHTSVTPSGKSNSVIVSSQHQKQEDVDSRTGGPMKSFFNGPLDPMFYRRTDLKASNYNSTGDDATGKGSAHDAAATSMGGGVTSKATATAASKAPTDVSVGQTEEDS